MSHQRPPDTKNCVEQLLGKAASASMAHEARDYAEAAHTAANARLALQHHDRLNRRKRAT